MIDLFKTTHGSRLYGLNHANSDEDWYSVHLGLGKATQNISGDQDVLRVDYSMFLDQFEKGVPQALEAMFSSQIVYDNIPFIRRSAVPNFGKAVDTYSRTIRGFARSKKDTLKRQRHAIRLTLNLDDLWRTGRFDPTLDKKSVDLVRSLENVIDSEELIEQLSSLGAIDLRKD